MARSKTANSASSIAYKIPCTSSESQLCGIFRDIVQWNEILWQCGLGLREDSLGKLSLVIVRDICDDGFKRKVMRAVAKRLHHLLTRHHCVTSMEIRVWMFWRFDELVCDALCNSLGLRKLKLIVSWHYFTQPPAHSFGAALLHMNHLRELACEGKHMDRSFAQGLSEFLASTSSLRTLNLSKCSIKDSNDAVAILEGLGRNKSIATLSINTSLLYPEVRHFKWQRYALSATGYLFRNKRLRTLSVTSHMPHFRLVHSMIETLLTNRYLTELSLINIMLEPRDMELINQLIIENKTLTSLSLINFRFHEYAGHIHENAEAVTSRSHSFVLALTNNNTLQQLTLTPSWFNTNEYRSLVEAVASHASLKQVNLDVPKRKDAVEIYRVVRENGAQDRFYRGMQNVLPENADLFSRKEALAFLLENAVAFTEATGPSGVIVDSQVFFGYAQLLTTLTSQPSCSHVSSFWLLLTRELLNITVTSEIAQYLRDTTTLRDLKLGFDEVEVGDAVCEARWELLLALSVNRGVRRLGVYGFWNDEDDTRWLADTLLSSRTLCHVFFFPSCNDTIKQLVRRLSPKHFKQLHPPQHQRTLHIIGKAEIGAAEYVQFNPGLVEKVQELTLVSEKEAACLIKARLMKIAELDDFMRLAGVVKHRVTCHSRDDGEKQLVDIGRDCWLYIRQYLKLGDVRNEQ
ncbi:hypothetical protein MRX96_009493 [Rhipicephalus microplus]